MKFTALILLSACIGASANGHSQNVTIALKNAPLEKVFTEIKKQTGYFIFYNYSLLENTKPVTIKVKNFSVDQVMKACLEDQPLDYEIADKSIVIKAKKQARLTDTLPPPLDVKGKVRNETGEPLAGISITVKGGSGGTTTDGQGEFRIQVSKGTILVFSFVGYEEKQVPVNNETSALNIQMVPIPSSLNEVVVIGYGTQRKSDLTGSVATVSTERFDAKPNTNVMQALQGAIPGISIVSNTGGAEQSDVSILIRGRNSINASNEPLIVLDGVPYTGNISDINTSDVKSMTVLKDASATAIYGSRGANGVILIESKKGQGAIKISYSGYAGVSKVANIPELYDGAGFAKFKETREPGELTVYELERVRLGEQTDWVDLATQNGVKHEHNLSVSGATDKVKYYFSAGILDAKGVTLNDKFKRYSLRVNLGFDITKNLKFGSSTQLTRIDRSGLGPTFGGDNGLFFINPLGKAYNDDGSLTIYPWPDDNFFVNPLGNTLAVNDNINNKVFTSNYLEYSFPFLKGLSYKLNTGIEYGVRSEKTYMGRGLAEGFTTNGKAAIDDDKDENYLLENILRYSGNFGKHAIDFTAVYSAQKTKRFTNDVDASGFSGDLLTYHQINQAANLISNTDFSQSTLLSQMGRLNYSYDGRYMATFTARRDGYSGFGSDSKYGIFPSVALAWHISQEDFFPKGIMSNAKLRLSYGKNGNQAVGPYDNLAQLTDFAYIDGGNIAPGYVPTRLGNDDLRWETSTTFNIGADMGFLNDRIQLSVDVYDTRTSDLLLDRLIPSVHGVSIITQNIGETKNQGLELSLSGYAIDQRNLKWNISGNIAYNKNEIVSLFGKDQDDIGNGLFIGKPIEVNYGYVFNGIWQTGEKATGSAQPAAVPGDVKVKDLANTSLDNAGNPILQISSNDDREIQGQTDPKMIWGLENTFKYKNLTLYVFLHGVTGVTRRNSTKDINVFGGVRRNWFVMDFWTPENPHNNYPRNNPAANNSNVGFYENASFMRVKDITLSYNLKDAWFGRTGISGVRIYATARNLITVTRWEGMDPELTSQNSIPLQKEYVFGLNFSL